MRQYGPIEHVNLFVKVPNVKRNPLVLILALGQNDCISQVA